MNKVILVGRITADIELKHIGAKNTPCVNFSVAVKRDFNKEEADFINCTVFNASATFLSKYASKGNLVLVEGQLQIDKYAKDNKNNYLPKVIVSKVEILQKNEKAEQVIQQELEVPSLSDSDLPF